MSTRMHVFVLATTVSLASVACRPETSDEAHKAAAVVEKERSDLEEAKRDLSADVARTDRHAREVVDETGQLARAAAEFVLKRGTHFRTVQAQLAVAEIDGAVLGSLAATPNIEVEDRAKVDEKMAVLRLRTAEAKRAIELLHNATAGEFPALEKIAAEAMSSLDDARDDAWEVIEDARDDVGSTYRPPFTAPITLP